jgi:hypothetical protein
LKKKKDREYYAEAARNGDALVFHMLPKAASDATEDYEPEKKGERVATQRPV